MWGSPVSMPSGCGSYTQTAGASQHGTGLRQPCGKGLAGAECIRPLAGERERETHTHKGTLAQMKFGFWGCERVLACEPYLCRLSGSRVWVWGF